MFHALFPCAAFRRSRLSAFSQGSATGAYIRPDYFSARPCGTPCPPLGWTSGAPRRVSRPPIPYFCHTGHGPLVRGKTLRSSFSFLYYTYHNIFQILLQRHDAAATAEPHPLRFCMVERPQAHRARNARGSGGPPYPLPRAYRRPACLAKGAQLCYNVKNNRYGGNRIWSF